MVLYLQLYDWAAMKVQDFRVGLRILLKDPAYSLVAVLGLGVGMAACILLLGFTRFSLQYDLNVPAAGEVYIVKQRRNAEHAAPWYDQAPLVVLKAAGNVPGVSIASGYMNWLPFTVQVDGQVRKINSLTVLPGFAEMMGLHAVKGDIAAALSRPDAFAITERTAMRLFGSTDVIGRPVKLNSVEDNNGVARIAAILPDPPANTTIPYEALNGVNLALMPQMLRGEALTGVQGWWGNLLVRMKPGASPAAVRDAMQQAADHAPALQAVPPETKARLVGRRVIDIELSPLRSAYFDHDVANSTFSRPIERGNPATVAAVAGIAILILALAAINYVNLSALRIVRRQREIAMRKVLGASAPRLASQFLAESLLVALMATGCGLLLAWMALPVFGQLLNLDLSSLLSAGNITGAVAIGLAAGLVTAIYPLRIAFSVLPAQALAGRPNAESRSSRRIRQILSVLQLGAAMGLASVAMAIAVQTRFAIGASPGFDPAPLLVFELPEAQTVIGNPQARGLVADLARQPGVAGVAVSNAAVGVSKDKWSTDIKREGGPAVPMDVKSVSANFFETYGIKAGAGRLFVPGIDKEDDTVPVVINAVAARQLGYAAPEQALGQTLLFNGFTNGQRALIPKRVVGIAPEIRFYSLRERPVATAYELTTAGATITVRSTGQTAGVDAAIRFLWPRYFPNNVLELRAAKDIYAANYADDARLARLLALATAIALIIAGVGAYILAADAVQRRTQEIALRKLHGARGRDIGKLVASGVGIVIVLAALIGLPPAALAIERYLAVYVEHAPMGLWALWIALAATLATAALAVGRQAWIAITLKPSVALSTH